MSFDHDKSDQCGSRAPAPKLNPLKQRAHRDKFHSRKCERANGSSAATERLPRTPEQNRCVHRCRNGTCRAEAKQETHSADAETAGSR